eukprot:scaffold94276_cov57-Phaeocystis_antarctica.AAC.11
MDNAKQITAQQEPDRLGSRSSAPGQGRAGRGALNRRPPRRSRCSYGCPRCRQQAPYVLRR